MKLWEAYPQTSDRGSYRQLLLFVAIAFAFNLAIRMIWVYQFQGTDAFMWNGQFMINTNDGYAWAEGARDILAGSHQANDLSPVDKAPALLTAGLAKILPVSFESLLFYMPAVLGSLIVVPLLLIGRLFGQNYAGLIAALLGGITYSYYNRTMVGYYDTDMLNIVLPLMIVWSVLFALIEQRNRYLLITTALVIFYSWWYESSYTLNVTIGAGVLLYTLIFERTNRFNYKLIAFYLIGIAHLLLLVKVALALALFLLFHFENKRIKYVEFIVLGGAIVLFFATGGIAPIVSIFEAYAIRGAQESASAVQPLHFYNVMDTVREAGHIPFTVLAERLSGHVVTFGVGLIGYLLLLARYRLMLLTLPLFGLGMFAIWGGLRFTVYAVPFFALGTGFAIVALVDLLSSKIAKIGAGAVLSALVLLPNVFHAIEYKVPTVMTKEEVDLLDRFQKIAGRKDYVVTWWDYGYPIRYYADVKTWVDGGKHSGDVNFPASYVLTAQEPLSAARMMRLFTEYTERGYADPQKSQNDFEYMMHQEGFDDSDSFLDSLGLPERTLPHKTRDVYLYLPLRMFEIFPTVALFSNLDLTSGEERPQPFFYPAQMVQDNGEVVELGQGISILKPKGVLKMGNREIPIKSFYQVGYNQNRQLQVNEQTLASEGLNVIYLGSYGKLLVVDDYYLNSTYFQMFFFERYDKNLFEPVILDPMSKIYKLKI